MLNARRVAGSVPYRYGEMSMRDPQRPARLATRVRETNRILYSGGARMILIHGYNVEVSQARASYADAMSRLAESSPGLARALVGSVWWLHWPGDLKRPTPKELPAELKRQSVARLIASTGSYPWQIESARLGGRLLARFLLDNHRAGQTGPVVLVAHSLGCRLVSETLLQLHSDGGRQPTEVTLMAAAVPTFMWRSRRRFGELTSIASRVSILHSYDDYVLAYTFPIGQTARTLLSREKEGFFPLAVGAVGEPTDLEWHRQHTKLGHGEYWSSTELTDQLRSIVRRVKFGSSPLPRRGPHHHDLRERRMASR